MTEIKITIHGLDDVLTELDFTNEEIVNKAYNIISEELNDAVLERGTTQAPVRTGYLRRTSYVYPIKTKNSFYVKAGFSANYAGYVDERHGTKSGFFSENIAEAVTNINRRIKDI